LLRKDAEERTVVKRLDSWTDHTFMSEPTDHAAALTDLPSDISLLSGIIQGLLVHSDWLTAYGLGNGQLHADSRRTLPVTDRLADVLERDARPLQITRSPDKRAVGTCRDFALMLCSVLRSKRVPSRLRCGFAAYFSGGWEDHWVCEYWDGAARRWRLSDPQLDVVLRERLGIKFESTDVPRQSFVTAGKAWQDCRAGRSEPARFGHGEAAGLWFIMVNVVRDHYALNGREISEWDAWREASSEMQAVREHDVALLDDLAATPERELIEVVPPWRT